jgi:hypothetical protein
LSSGDIRKIAAGKSIGKRHRNPFISFIYISDMIGLVNDLQNPS